MGVIRFMVILCVAVAAAGCKSRPLGPYVSPRVTGRVLAGDSGLPLAGVKVTRGKANSYLTTGTALKGGELLMLKVPVQSGRDGRFVLTSERVLSVVRGAGWNYVALSFERSGYQSFRTNCSISLASTPTNGQPVLDVGTIRLQPLASSQ